MVTVTATSENETFSRKFLAVRQDKTEFIGTPEAITPMCNKGDVITEKDKNVIVEFLYGLVPPIIPPCSIQPLLYFVYQDNPSSDKNLSII